MLCSFSLLEKIIQEAKSINKKIVFTNGCFDIIHSGHCQYLSEAKKLGDILVVGLNSDSSVKKLKGEERPINSFFDRAAVLSSLKSVDYVCIFEEETPIRLITALRPDVLVKGGDYTIDNIVGASEVISNGGNVVVLPFLEGRSTTKIINKFKS